jgi:adenosylcobinamide kinase/adenosylcobinamide-phosphate guanylyltransferase
MRELILGGVRSGKSRLAERHAEDSGLAVVYVATAEVRDEEMRQRILHHQARRPANWQLVEAGGDLAAVLQREDADAVRYR